MKKTTAYIDASNLKFGIKQSGWDLDEFIENLRQKTKRPPDTP